MHSRALVSVSSVPNVLLDTMNSVVAGSSPGSFCAASVGSMLLMKRHSNPSLTYGASASYAITGPRSEPPIPMLTTVRIGSPVTPVHSPDRTCSANA